MDSNDFQVLYVAKNIKSTKEFVKKYGNLVIKRCNYVATHGCSPEYEELMVDIGEDIIKYADKKQVYIPLDSAHYFSTLFYMMKISTEIDSGLGFESVVTARHYHQLIMSGLFAESDDPDNRDIESDFSLICGR